MLAPLIDISGAAKGSSRLDPYTLRLARMYLRKRLGSSHSRPLTLVVWNVHSADVYDEVAGGTDDDCDLLRSKRNQFFLFFTVLV